MARIRYWENENKRTPEIQNTFACFSCNKFRQILGRRKREGKWICFECVDKRENEIAGSSQGTI